MAHPENTKYLSIHIPSQLPEFTREDHATFVSFMEAYFEFLDQQGGAAEIINALSDYGNIDKTVDTFVDHFKETYLHDIPNKVVTDKEFLVKNIREFYRARGSEKSFQFLFRTMFQEEVTLDHPKDQILKPSDGDWIVDKIVKIPDFGDSGKWQSREMTGSTSNATAIVENVVTIRENKFDVSELLISNIIGTFQIGETVTGTDKDGNAISAVLNGMIGSVTVDNPGSNYSVGDELIVTGGGGQFGEGRILIEDSTGLLVKEDGTHIVSEDDFGVNMKVSVKELQGGTIDSVIIANGGTGYSKGDYLTLNNTDKLQDDGYPGTIRINEVAGRVTSLTLTNAGQNYLNPPLVTFTVPSGETGSGAQAVTTLTGGAISSATISYGGTNYDVNDTISFIEGNGLGATGVVTSINETEQLILQAASIGSGDGNRIVSEDGDFFCTEASQGITGVTIIEGGSGYLTEPEAIITAGETQILLEDGSFVMLEMESIEPYIPGAVSKLTKEHSGGNGALLVPNGWGRVGSIKFDPSDDFSGKNYSVAPTVVFTTVGLSGSGASASTTISGTTANGKILEIEIENPGKDYSAIPTVDATGKGNGDATITLGSTTIGGIRLVSIQRPGYNITKAPLIDASSFGDGNAILTSTASAMFLAGDGHWEGTKSFISHDKYLQDSKFYQIYSYVINHGGQTADFWRETVKRVLHPAGFNLFSQVDIISEMGLPLTTMSIKGPSGTPGQTVFHDLPGEPEGIGEDVGLILHLTFSLANTFDFGAKIAFASGQTDTTLIFLPGGTSGLFVVGETITLSNGTTAVIVAITENGIVIDDSTLTGELVEGNTVTGGTSGATATVDEVKKPSGLITELRSFGPNWKTIDYQKFFTHGGFSNKDDEDSNIRMEGPERERLSKEGTHRNPLRFNLEFVSVGDTPNWPTTDNYEIVGRLIMEDGNYLLSEVAQGNEQIIYEDGDTPRLEEHGTGGAWTLEHFKDIVLGTIIDDNGKTKSNVKKRLTSESHVNLIPYP